tara:strand:+ start:1534 stop:2553 length:1020 start_codon:yes stop_codon:yes gene_type:complete
MKTAIIFGGTGFIGSFFARHLIEDLNYSKVFLYDYESFSEKDSNYRINMFNNNQYIEFIRGDVREEIKWMPSQSIDLIANFAAIHREPGHEDFEYFECNILGAENVCAWAERVNCKHLIFSSSIAPYGPSEDPKDEDSIPVPITPYGSSKLVAENIHQTWQSKDTLTRKLVIIRPGVVFGPSEGGNVSRLIKAVLNRYFVYTGNKNTRKAGVYIKELCNALIWVFESEKAKKDGVTLFNMTMNPGPSIRDYVESIARIEKKRVFVPNLPSTFLIIIATILDFFLSIFKITHPFSPLRIRKLTRSNNIIPSYLINNKYKYKYSLDSALKDWKNECPEEWG